MRVFWNVMTIKAFERNQILPFDFVTFIFSGAMKIWVEKAYYFLGT